MYKLIALYKRPDDVEAFDKHYDEIHSPLIRKVPGLQKLSVSRSLRAFAGDAPYYLMAEMEFADKEAFKAAMASEENKAAGKDLMGFAGSLVTMVHGEFNDAV